MNNKSEGDNMIKKKQMMSNIESLIKEKGKPTDIYIKTNDERKGKYGINKYNNDIILVFNDEEVIVNNTFYYSVAQYMVSIIDLTFKIYRQDE